MSDCKQNFTRGEVVFYPGHGVGTITDTTTQTIAGVSVPTISVAFARERLVAHIPADKAQQNGLQPIADFADQSQIDKALRILRGKATGATGNPRATRVKRLGELKRARSLEEIARLIRDLTPKKDADIAHSYEQLQKMLSRYW